MLDILLISNEVINLSDIYIWYDKFTRNNNLQYFYKITSCDPLFVLIQ